MSSTILYKFRASSTFEALPLPGSAARLFDVKKVIVKANKLDAGSMEFDLAVRNADTNEEYADESMLLPRGTRIIVQRLPAARGQGFLARMVRNEHGGGIGSSYHHQQQHPSGYYNIDNRTRENEEEEFVESSNTAPVSESNDDKELAALQAVTSMQPDGPTMVGGRSTLMANHRGGRGGPPQPAGMGGPTGGTKPSFNPTSNSSKQGNPTYYRPNADPELREKEQKQMPKKRATGIPRTFLSLSSPPQIDGSKEAGEGEQVPLLQPNKQGFKDLVSRGGGQSESTAGTRRDLDYVLKLTSTTVPEHLKCAICNTVVKNAMLLPWDSEGRTVSETCIRDALTQNGFRCPLTGMDGVSPDDLIANVGLRKAVDMFIESVMEKVDEIEKQQVLETETAEEDATEQSSEKNVLDGEGAEKGVIVSKRMSLTSRKKPGDDILGIGDEDFGGDVFAVEGKNGSTEDRETEINTNEQEPYTMTADTISAEKRDPDRELNRNSNKRLSKDTDNLGIDDSSSSKVASLNNKDTSNTQKDETNDRLNSRADFSSSQAFSNDGIIDKASNKELVEKSTSPKPHPPTSSHMRFHRRRGPPVGYAMGPAGGAVVSARVNHQSNQSNNYHGGNNDKDNINYHRGGYGGAKFSPKSGGRHGQYGQERSGGDHGKGRDGRSRGRGRGNARFDLDPKDVQKMDDDESGRGTKRVREDQLQNDGVTDGQKHWERNGRGNSRNDGGGGKGSHGRGGGHKGSRGGKSRGRNRGSRGNRSRY